MRGEAYLVLLFGHAQPALTPRSGAAASIDDGRAPPVLAEPDGLISATAQRWAARRRATARAGAGLSRAEAPGAQGR